MAKKIFLILLAFIGILAIGAAIFVLTFDINTYKASIEKQLSSIMGNSVEIGKLSLKWKGFISLGVEGFKTYVEENGKRDIALSFDRAEAALDIAPIFRRQLQISSITIERINMQAMRTKDAKIEIKGYHPRPSQVAVAKAGLSAGPAIGFNIAAITINDSIVRFQDMMREPNPDITLKNINAQIKNVSLTTPMEFSSRMAFASDKQNISISGIFGGFVAGNIFLKDFMINTDFATLIHDELVRSIPALEKAGLKDGLAGKFDLKIRELQLNGGKFSRLSADFELKNGRVVLAKIKAPIEKINMSASAEDNAITIRSFSAGLANGSLSSAAKIEDVMTTPRMNMDTAVEIQGLRTFITEVLSAKHNIDGNARLTFNGNMKGITWPEIQTSLSGNGVFSLDKGILLETNVLEQSLNALTIFPGLSQMVASFVPEQVRMKLQEEYTILKPINISYVIKDSYANLPDFKIETDLVDITGQARISLTGDLSGDGRIRFSPSISEAMIKAFSQIRYLADRNGIVEFPISFKGGQGTFKVMPDLKYVGEKVAVQKAQEMATSLLKKAMGQSKGAEAAQGETSKASTLKNILNELVSEAKPAQ